MQCGVHETKWENRCPRLLNFCSPQFSSYSQKGLISDPAGFILLFPFLSVVSAVLRHICGLFSGWFMRTASLSVQSYSLPLLCALLFFLSSPFFWLHLCFLTFIFTPLSVLSPLNLCPCPSVDIPPFLSHRAHLLRIAEEDNSCKCTCLLSLSCPNYVTKAAELYGSVSETEKLINLQLCISSHA